MAFKNNAGTLKKAVDYTYDAQDRRVTKSLDSTGDGVVDRREFYAYDGANVTLDYVDTDGDVGGAGGAQPAVARRYLFGPAVDQVLAVEDVTVATSAATRVLWHLTDTQGTVRDLVNRTGAHVEHYHYDSFGKLLSVKDGAGNPLTTPSTRYGYTGRELDTDTGLMYYRARWYDPAVGRFISEDPIGFAGDPSNLTRYVRNGPTIYVDPTGLDVEWFINVNGYAVRYVVSKGTTLPLPWAPTLPGHWGQPHDQTSGSISRAWGARSTVNLFGGDVCNTIISPTSNNSGRIAANVGLPKGCYDILWNWEVMSSGTNNAGTAGITAPSGILRGTPLLAPGTLMTPGFHAAGVEVTRVRGGSGKLIPIAIYNPNLSRSGASNSPAQTTTSGHITILQIKKVGK